MARIIFKEFIDLSGFNSDYASAVEQLNSFIEANPNMLILDYKYQYCYIVENAITSEKSAILAKFEVSQ